MKVPYSYKIYRLLLFVILLLIINKLAFGINDMDHLKWIVTPTIVFMFVDIYYPSVKI